MMVLTSRNNAVVRAYVAGEMLKNIALDFCIPMQNILPIVRRAGMPQRRPDLSVAFRKRWREKRFRQG